MASRLQYIISAQDKTKGATSSATKNISDLDKKVKDFSAAMSAMAVVAAGKAAYELGRLGAQSIRTRNAFIAISGGAGEAEARLDAMKRATRGALSEQEAMAAANRLMQMGLATNTQELGNVTEMAVRLGTAMGRDASQSIEEFALLLANQSIPRLDTFGISAGRVRTRINELRDANKDLTREQAFLQAVTEEGTAAMERLGDASEDDALAFEKFEASVENLKAALGEGLAPEMASAINTIAGVTERLGGLQRAYSDVRAEQGWFVKALGKLVPGLYMVGTAIDASSEEAVDMDSILRNARHAVDGWRAGWDAAREATEQAAERTEELRRRQEELPGALEATRGAARLAADTLYDLSTSAGQVAGSFGEMKFDPESLWNMAMASGASVEALAALAENLGIATEAEIQASLEAWAIVEAFGRGGLSAEEYEAGMLAARDGLRAANVESEKTIGQLEGLSGGMVDAEDDALSLRDSLGGVAGELYGMEHAARMAQDALSRIEREVKVDVYYREHGQRPGGGGTQQYQHGTAYHPGGWAIVGDEGPEMVALPRGSRVFPNYSPVTQRAIHNRFEGDQVTINNSMAAAMYLDQRRRRRIERVEARM